MGGEGIARMADAAALADTRMQMLGQDVFITGRIAEAAEPMAAGGR